jgi:hypothetical protein
MGGDAVGGGLHKHRGIHSSTFTHKTVLSCM